MLEHITSENYKDFAYRYCDTFGFITSERGNKIVVSIKDVNANCTTVVDADGNYFSLANDKGNILEFTQVKSCWWSPEDGVVAYIARMPERQWKRGISRSNTVVLIPNLTTDGSSLIVCSITTEIIKQLYYPTEDNIIFPHIKGKLNCGIWSKYFVWAGNYVWAKDICIGTVDHTKKQITLEQQLLWQELSDCIKKSKHKEYVVCG